MTTRLELNFCGPPSSPSHWNSPWPVWPHKQHEAFCQHIAIKYNNMFGLAHDGKSLEIGKTA
jgi:hypothetical protein